MRHFIHRWVALGAVLALPVLGATPEAQSLQALGSFVQVLTSVRTNGQVAIAATHTSVKKDPKYFEELVYKGVSRNNPEDAPLIESRKQVHAGLIEGHEWRIVREHYDRCIHLREDLHWGVTNALESAELLSLGILTNQFSLISAYDAQRRHGWVAAMYQPKISSVLTAEEGSDLDLCDLQFARGIEPDLALFALLALGQTNASPPVLCHPLLYDFSHFKPDPAAIRRSLESGRVNVEPTGTPGLHRIRFHEKDGIDVTIDFAPDASIPVPRILVGPESKPARLITREIVRGKPWSLEWKETLRDDSGKQTEFKHRYLLADGPADVPALLNALDDRFRGSKLRSHQDAKGEYVSRMDGRVVSRHRDPRPGSGLTAAHLTIAVCVVIAILVTTGLLIVRLFRPRP